MKLRLLPIQIVDDLSGEEQTVRVVYSVSEGKIKIHKCSDPDFPSDALERIIFEHIGRQGVKRINWFWVTVVCIIIGLYYFF